MMLWLLDTLVRRVDELRRLFSSNGWCILRGYIYIYIKMSITIIYIYMYIYIYIYYGYRRRWMWGTVYRLTQYFDSKYTNLIKKCKQINMVHMLWTLAWLYVFNLFRWQLRITNRTYSPSILILIDFNSRALNWALALLSKQT